MCVCRVVVSCRMYATVRVVVAVAVAGVVWCGVTGSNYKKMTTECQEIFLTTRLDYS